MREQDRSEKVLGARESISGCCVMLSPAVSPQMQGAFWKSLLRLLPRASGSVDQW